MKPAGMFRRGFINGIRSKLSGASQAGRDLGLAALNAAKKALDSHSPSREFIELGKTDWRGYDYRYQQCYRSGFFGCGKDE